MLLSSGRLHDRGPVENSSSKLTPPRDFREPAILSVRSDISVRQSSREDATWCRDQKSSCWT